MNMRLFSINKYILASIFVLLSLGAKAKEKVYDDKLKNYKDRWGKLIPTHTKVQFAGNMGLVSTGFGWDYGKRNQWETDLFFGIIPKYNSSRTRITTTLKTSCMPWNIKINRVFSFEPLSCGIYLNTVLGKDFWIMGPERYPKGYYGFSTKLRTHAFIGQRITCLTSGKRRFFAKSITAFYEISSCDLLIVSTATNRYLKPLDYISLSFGFKMQIF